MTSEDMRFNGEIAIGICLTAIVFVIYVLTSYPSLAGGDSGELLAEACQLGVAHPPGYPLFIIFSSVFSKLPMIRPLLESNGSISFDFNPTIGWKMTQFSSACGAITFLFIYLAICLCNSTVFIQKTHSSAIVAAGFSSLSFAFMPLVWEYSVSAEVFALNNCLCAVLLYLTLRIAVLLLERRDRNQAILSLPYMPIYLGAFISGLAFSNQHTSVLHVSFLILCIIILLFYRLHISSAVQVMILSGISCLMGFSPYIHLYSAAKLPRRGSWGDTSNIEGLFRHVLRSEYGTFRLGFIEGSESAYERIRRYFVFTNEQMNSTPILVAILFILTFLVNFGWRIYMDSKIVTEKCKFKPSHPSSTISSRKSTKGGKAGNSTISSGNKDTAVPIDSIKADEDYSSHNTATVIVAILLGNFLWYTLLWHGIFSNLPLSNPMAFGVHSRFWMQPNITLSVLNGVAVQYLVNTVASSSSTLVRTSVSSFGQVPILVIFIAFILRSNWMIVNRSDALGWTMHRYGENILRNIPHDSILLSHTDLDLNPVRYLQNCQAASSLRTSDREVQEARPVIHHLSLQMMPYPWFATQQEPLYANSSIVFPRTQFTGVSTDRLSEGNARLITNFLVANLPPPEKVGKGASKKSKKPKTEHSTRAIFLDMQAVNEAEIQSLGSWRGFLLVPYGLEYLVVPPYFFLNTTTGAEMTPLSAHAITSRYHLRCWQALQKVKENFPVIDDHFNMRFPRGTWEAAAMNVFFDAHYQLGLFYLTWVMDEESGISIDTLAIILDRLLASAQLLQETWDAASTYRTFSSSMRDLQRNTALAYMRLQAVLGVIHKMQEKIQGSILTQLEQSMNNGKDTNDGRVYETRNMYSPPDAKTIQELPFLVPDLVRAVVTQPPDSEINRQWKQRIATSIAGFVRDHPDDANVAVFTAAAKQAKAQLK